MGTRGRGICRPFLYSFENAAENNGFVPLAHWLSPPVAVHIRIPVAFDGKPY